MEGPDRAMLLKWKESVIVLSFLEPTALHFTHSGSHCLSGRPLCLSVGPLCLIWVTFTPLISSRLSISLCASAVLAFLVFPERSGTPPVFALTYSSSNVCSNYICSRVFPNYCFQNCTYPLLHTLATTSFTLFYVFFFLPPKHWSQLTYLLNLPCIFS